MTNSSPSPSADVTSVTLVAWQALPAIDPNAGRNIGGLETGAWRLAKNLAALDGVESSIVVRSSKRRSPQVVDGVRVVPHVNPREYTRRDVSQCLEFGKGVRVKQWSPNLLWQVPYLGVTWPFRQRDPQPMSPDPRLMPHPTDLWIALGASRDSAGVIATAAAQNKPSMLMLQSNADLDARYLSDPQWRNPYGEIGEHCRFAIDHASVVVCQTEWQREQLRQRFDRDGVVLKNACDPTPWQAAARQQSANNKQGRYVFWLGRYDQFHKRTELAIEIARRCPEIPFQMVINHHDPEVEKRILANRPANVTIGDYLPYDALPDWFAESRLLLCTGSAEYEGFPTILLHAAATEVPIVSLDDFDDFIARSRAGVTCPGGVEEAAEAIKRLWQSSESIDRQHALAYLKEHHSADVIASDLANLIAETTNT